MDARAHLWLLNQGFYGSSLPLFGGGALSRSSRVARLRSTSGQQIGGTGFASRAVTARKKRKRGFFKRLKLGKLLRVGAHFIPGAGQLTSLVI